MRRRTLFAGLLSIAAVSMVWLQTASAQTSRVFSHPSGFGFQYPADWRLDATGDMIVLLPPGAHAGNPAESIRVASQPVVVAADEPRFGVELDQMMAQFAGFRKAGISHPYRTTGGSPGLTGLWSGVNLATGQDVHLRVYAATVNGIAVVIFAAGTADRLTLRDAVVQNIAATVGPAGGPAVRSAPVSQDVPHPSTADANPLAQFWLQRMRGKLLTQLSGYNGGGGSGGMSSKTVIHLQANGLFQAHSSSSVSISVPGVSGSSGGTNRAAGTWRIYASGAQVLLEMRYDNGQIESNLLQANGEQTLINGKRWFVTEPQ